MYVLRKEESMEGAVDVGLAIGRAQRRVVKRLLRQIVPQEYTDTARLKRVGAALGCRGFEGAGRPPLSAKEMSQRRARLAQDRVSALMSRATCT